MNISSIRSQFPIFNRSFNGKLLIFLDSAASAQKPQVVIDAMIDVMKNHYANVNRGVYFLSEEVTQMVEDTRGKVQKFIGAKYPEEIIFTRNTTESINLVMYAWARNNLKTGDVIVLSEMEHHSNIVPWQMLRDDIGVELKWISVSGDGYLELDSLKRNSRNVKLVCVTHVSNVLGTVNPIKEIAEWARSIDAKILVDGAQAVTNLTVNVSELDIDWYVFSGHKLYGPTGVGVLYGKKNILNEMDPFLCGGDMILDVSKDKTVYKETPHKFEAGTPAIVEIIGLGKAIDFIIDIGLANIRSHSEDLLVYILEKLSLIKGITVYGPNNIDDRVGVVSFTLNGVHPHDIATILNENGVAIRSGHHCAQLICDRYEQSAMARVSFGVYNDKSDVDAFINAINNVISIFKL